MNELGPSCIKAVLFDLDDTLYLQQDYLELVWHHVALTAAADGVDQQRLETALGQIAGEGTDKGFIIDRALELCGADVHLSPRLVEEFRRFRPPQLRLFPGCGAALNRLRDHVPIALVSDGAPEIQRAKLAALGLTDAFDIIVLSDELGRGFRKPHSAPFLRALELLGCLPEEAVFVGDRPSKDIAGAFLLNMRTIRVCTGEYASQADLVPTSCTVASAVVAIEVILAALSFHYSEDSDAYRSERQGDGPARLLLR